MALDHPYEGAIPMALDHMLGPREVLCRDFLPFTHCLVL